MTERIPIPLTHNLYRVRTPAPSPPLHRYPTIHSWYKNEAEKIWQTSQFGSTSTMPIPTTPVTITQAIREKVATAFDKLEGEAEGEDEVDQRTCCSVIYFGGEGERTMWGVEEGVRVVDWEGLSEQAVRNLCHVLPGMLRELGLEEDGEEVENGGDGEGEIDGEVEEDGARDVDGGAERDVERELDGAAEEDVIESVEKGVVEEEVMS